MPSLAPAAASSARSLFRARTIGAERLSHSVLEQCQARSTINRGFDRIGSGDLKAVA